MLPDISEFRCKHTLKVRWSEVDAQKVVFNGNYLNYFDIATTAYFEAIGLGYPAGFLNTGVDFFVRKAQILYHSSAHYNDELTIYVRIARLGNSSMQFLLEIIRQDTHIASGELVYVNVDAGAKKPKPIPESIRQLIAQFEGKSFALV